MYMPKKRHPVYFLPCLVIETEAAPGKGAHSHWKHGCQQVKNRSGQKDKQNIFRIRILFRIRTWLQYGFLLFLAVKLTNFLQENVMYGML